MKRRCEDIALSSIVQDGEFRNRTTLSVASLAKSMKKEGQVVAILVIRRGKNRFQLLSGFRRTAAARRLGWKTIRAEILEDISEMEAHRISLAENLARQDLTTWEKVAAALRFREMGYTNAVVAEMFGVKDRTIKRYLYVAREAPPDFQRALQRGEITVHQAAAALKSESPLSELLNHGRSVRYLQELTHTHKKSVDFLFRRSRDGNVQIRFPWNVDVASREAMIQSARQRLDKLEAELSNDE